MYIEFNKIYATDVILLYIEFYLLVIEAI